MSVITEARTVLLPRGFASTWPALSQVGPTRVDFGILKQPILVWLFFESTSTSFLPNRRVWTLLCRLYQLLMCLPVERRRLILGTQFTQTMIASQLVQVGKQ